MVLIDQIIRSRRKTIAIMVSREGQVIVRAPLRAREDLIRKLVQEKEAWIREQLDHVRAAYPRYTPKQFAQGEQFYYLGVLYPLHIMPISRPALRFEGAFYLAQSAQPQARKAFERWYRAEAARLFTLRTAQLAALHGFQYQQIRITAARTRWGSCSSRGTLSFAWRLVMAPPQVIDYVILHELAHTRIPNHSRQYWNLVQSIAPEFKSLRNWLKINGHMLSLE